MALLRLPAALLIVLTEALLRSLYRSADGHGITVVRPQMLWRPFGAVLGAMVIFLTIIAAAAMAASLAHPSLFGWVAGALIALLALSMVSSLSNPSPASLRRELRAMGDRDAWTIEVLAQRPGTGWSALALTRDLVDELVPVGTRITITAREPRLEKIYQRAGFTPTGNRTMTATAPLRRN